MNPDNQKSPPHMRFLADRTHEYREKGYWGDATLLDYWNMSVLAMPEKICIVDAGGTAGTYRQMNKQAAKVAAFLRKQGVEPGDVVSVQLPGWVEFLMVYVGCLKAGAVINPILPSFRAEEMQYILSLCESKVVFIPCTFRRFHYPPMLEALRSSLPALKAVVTVEKESAKAPGLTMCSILQSYRAALRKDAPETLRTAPSAADDLAAILFTSGSEGFPKGVMLTHNNIIASERSFAASFGLACHDVMLMPAPVAHATGFHHGVTAPFMLGSTSILLDIFNPCSFLALLAQHRCTCSMGSTPFLHDILCALQQDSFDISSLRFFLCGGAPIPSHMVRMAQEAGFKVLGVYGSTESVPHTAVGVDDSFEHIAYTDGKAIPGIEVRVVDKERRPVPWGVEGEEASRGPNVFMGYFKQPELTARCLDENGWYYSGDLCVMDAEGYIRITGRKKDMIVRGGENISTVEVENILLQHPAVADAAVVAMPDPRLVERVCAYVVLHDAHTGFTMEEMTRCFAQKEIAQYKYPERLEIIDALPRTASGKVKKYALRQDIVRKMAEEAKG